MPTFQMINDYAYSQAVKQRYWDAKYFLDAFDSQPISGKVGGGAATGTAGDNDVLFTRLGNCYEYYIIGGQTILAPSFDGYGLNFGSQDQTSGHGIELNQGVTNVSPAAFLVGTDQAFMFNVEFLVATVAGCNPFTIGFRKAQAYNATLSNYTDFAEIGIVGTAGHIQTRTQTGSAGVITTDSTQLAVNATSFLLGMQVDASGNVTYTFNGQPLTVSVPYQFTTGLYVVPFIQFVQDATLTTQASCNRYEVGFVPSFAPD